jgi:hypothetical protein
MCSYYTDRFLPLVHWQIIYGYFFFTISVEGWDIVRNTFQHQASTLATYYWIRRLAH